MCCVVEERLGNTNSRIREDAHSGDYDSRVFHMALWIGSTWKDVDSTDKWWYGEPLPFRREAYEPEKGECPYFQKSL